MLISDVVGHSRAKKILNNALSEKRVAHAYLFHGPNGSGKTTLARAFAGALLCPNATNDACGTCSVCRRVSEEQFADFFIVSPSGNNIKIEQVREIQKKAQLKPYEGQRKVYLITPSETMTIEAANCLLKILEEPPLDTVFILTAVNPHNLLPTIISRCQLIPLSEVSKPEIEEMLLKRNLVDPEKAKLIASLSDGLPGKALEMASEGTELEDREFSFQLLDQIAKGNINDLLKAAEELEKRKDIIPEVLEHFLLWYRDRLLWSQTKDEKFIFNIDKLGVIKETTNISEKEDCINNIYNILEAKKQIDQNVNLRLSLEVLMLRLAKRA